MTTQLDRDLLTLSAASDWLECIEEDVAEDDVDLSLRRAIRDYIRELQYRTGIQKAYSDDLDRLRKLKDAMRSLDPVYDLLGELADSSDSLPHEMQSLLGFMGSMAADMGWVISVTESQYPQWADAFAAERRMYSEWQAGRGPLAGAPWRKDDEAEAS
jgi:hypothetical protein